MDKSYDYDYENEYDYTWDDRYYGTGNTQPPKEKHGLMALMLILVIFLFGIITVLGILNIRLFQELKLKKQETELSISFTTEATQPAQEESNLSIGRWEGNTYINEYTGYACVLDGSWQIYTAEDLQDLPEQIKETTGGEKLGELMVNFQQFTDMMAENTADLTTVNLLYQKLTPVQMTIYGSLTEEEVIEAAKLAGAHEFISALPDGYDTYVGERGVRLSGGQKQRISIARALMKDAPILILDDSVSAVDTKTEKTILENLHATRAGKTTILIAHRISTIERMDKILFIDDGKLVAVDTHKNLYATCPDYRKMVDLQKLEEEGGNYNA